MKHLMHLVVAVVLAGCGATSKQLDASTEACRAKVNTIGGYWACANPKERAVYVAHDTPNMELIDLWFAYRLALGNRVDRGEITKEEYDLAYAEVNARIFGEIERQRLARKQARAASTTSFANLLAGLALWNASTQPARPNIVTCHGSAGYVTCY